MEGLCDDDALSENGSFCSVGFVSFTVFESLNFEMLERERGRENIVVVVVVDLARSTRVELRNCNGRF